MSAVTPLARNYPHPRGPVQVGRTARRAVGPPRRVMCLPRFGIRWVMEAASATVTPCRRALVRPRCRPMSPGWCASPCCWPAGESQDREAETRSGCPRPRSEPGGAGPGRTRRGAPRRIATGCRGSDPWPPQRQRCQPGASTASGLLQIVHPCSPEFPYRASERSYCRDLLDGAVVPVVGAPIRSGIS